MATTATLTNARPGSRSATNLRAALTLIACMGLPMGAFGLVNLGAEQIGVLPLFFAPFGLPGWAGAIAHLVQLALLGGAFWAVTQHAKSRRARTWLAMLTAAYILLPFVTPPLDSLQLAMVCTALLLLALATARRAAAISPLAGWMMTPMLVVIGFSATMGLAIAAAYSPPFALMQGTEPAPAA
ncbi:hypothetical protein [Devosia sp. CAU 1758]